MSRIYRRKRTWGENPFGWMFLDRAEHFFRLKTIDIDGAAMLAAGILPEFYEGFGLPWFDTVFISNANGYEHGDDRNDLWQWMEDCKQRWLSDPSNSETVSILEFIDWVTQEYEEPHWMPALKGGGQWDAWTAPLARQQDVPKDRRATARELLQKHGGNKAAVGRDMGISRTRVNQLLADENLPTGEKRKPLSLSPSDPFGLASKSLKTNKN